MDCLWLQVYVSEQWFDVHAFLIQLPPKLEYEMLDFLYIAELKFVSCFAVMPERVLIALSGHVMPYHVCTQAIPPQLDFTDASWKNGHAHAGA